MPAARLLPCAARGACGGDDISPAMDVLPDGYGWCLNYGSDLSDAGGFSNHQLTLSTALPSGYLRVYFPADKSWIAIENTSVPNRPFRLRKTPLREAARRGQRADDRAFSMRYP